jgi:hypothetical protein
MTKPQLNNQVYDHSQSVKQSITKPFPQETQQPNKIFLKKLDRTQEVC